MAKTVLNLIMTFDGYVAGAHDEIDWIASTTSAAAAAATGEAQQWDFSEFTNQVGAIIVGKRSYDLGLQQGWFKDNAYGPSPIFVLCESAPEQPSKEADFRFVNDIDEMYKQASDAAGDKLIYLFGGPSVFQQFLNKDLVDEMRLTIAPILIGKGIRLFDNLTERHVQLEKTKLIEHPGSMIEVYYKIVK